MAVSIGYGLAVALQNAKERLAIAFKNKSPVTLVIGNQSADLDSFTSSVLYAYFRSVQTGQAIVPVLNIPRDDLSIRPEFSQVMGHAGISPDSLVTLDDLGPEDLYPQSMPPDQTHWILTDHNKLEGNLGKIYGQRVFGVIDHHEDENFISQDTGQEPRVIQPCGSCTTLVIDFVRSIWDQLRSGTSPGLGVTDSARIAKFAISSILIDTKNLMNPDKTTSKDIEVAGYLRSKIEEAENHVSWDQNAFWVALKDAKNDINSITTQGVFRKDYKEWTEKSIRFGTSSAVKRLSKLARKAIKEQDGDENAWTTAANTFMKNKEIDIWLVLTSYNDDEGIHKRELAFHWTRPELREIADRFEEQHAANLHLERSQLKGLPSDEGSPGRRTWIQHNSAMSRKQIAPIFRRVICNE